MLTTLRTSTKSFAYKSIYKLASSIRGIDADLAKRMSKRELMAAIYLSGDGLEIGALNSLLTVPREARVRYVDHVSAEDLHRQYGDLQVKAPDIVDDGGRLERIRDCSQDFLIACQMIEHCEDPIGAIKNWLRVLKPGGVLFVSIPDRRFTFDFYRPVTSLEHLLRDHQEGPGLVQRRTL